MLIFRWRTPYRGIRTSHNPQSSLTAWGQISLHKEEVFWGSWGALSTSLTQYEYWVHSPEKEVFSRWGGKSAVQRQTIVFFQKYLSESCKVWSFALWTAASSAIRRPRHGNKTVVPRYFFFFTRTLLPNAAILEISVFHWQDYQRSPVESSTEVSNEKKFLMRRSFRWEKVSNEKKFPMRRSFPFYLEVGLKWAFRSSLPTKSKGKKIAMQKSDIKRRNIEKVYFIRSY